MIVRGYADTTSGQVHYRERAGASTPIVFLHQTALSSRSYESLLRALSPGPRAIALDLPGFGESFRPLGWPTMARYAEWTFDALDALDVRDAWLFGHHTGASLAVEMAHRRPERVRGVMLCGPVCFTREEGQAFRADFEVALAPRADGGHLLENWRYAAGHNDGIAPDVLHEQVVDMLQAWRARPQAYVAVADHDFESAFAALRIPVQVITAPGDYFEDHVARCRALRPALEVKTVDGGNLAPELDAAGVAAAVDAFVTTGGSTGGG